MQYIKEYNNFNDYINTLRYFCETHLAYLLDIGYRVTVVKKQSIDIRFVIIIDNNDVKMDWNIVEDHLIVFLHILSDNYTMASNVFFGLEYKTHEVSYMDIIELSDIHPIYNFFMDSLEWIQIEVI